MIGVAKEDVLVRVGRDLAQGHTYLALQRLASLTVSYPDDLNVRARRAEVNRRIGHFAEAGRWGFLTDDVTERDLAAFERAWPKATSRLAVLRLQPERDLVLGERAQQRLASLLDAACEEERISGGAAASQSPARSDVGCLVAFALVMVVGLALLGIGIVTVVRAIL
jgi:hypothetical protein